MNVGGIELTPAPKGDALAWHYTWHNGKGDYPSWAGFVFDSKAGIAEQIYEDYPDRHPIGYIETVTHSPPKLGVGAVISGDGFGWYTDTNGNPKRFPHIGGVKFGLDVEVGSCATIDRGAIGDTIIGSYVKIDNGVHIGHNARIADRSILTAHCVIGGSAVIGEDCWIGLGAQIKNQIRIGDGVTVGMGAIVVKDVPAGVTVVGNPARILE